MTISDELATVLKQACKEVDTWEPWQRSRDPQGSEEITVRECKTVGDDGPFLDQQNDGTVIV